MAVEAVRPRPLDERAHRRRRRDADRVGEHHLGTAGERRGELRDDPGIDATLERAAERARDRHRRRGVARGGEDRLDAGDRLGERRVPVPEVEGLGRREGDVDAVEPGGGEALPAPLVEDEPRQLDAIPPLDALDHLLGAGHLRHAVVAHEADGLDPRQPHRGEPVDELGPRLWRQHLRLVLEAVPWPDVAEKHRHRASVLSERAATIPGT